MRADQHGAVNVGRLSVHVADSVDPGVEARGPHLLKQPCPCGSILGGKREAVHSGPGFSELGKLSQAVQQPVVIELHSASIRGRLNSRTKKA